MVNDFTWLTPERSAVVSADPYDARTLGVTVSGLAPTRALSVVPPPTVAVIRSTLVSATEQQPDPSLGADLGWPGVGQSTRKLCRSTRL
ncbi:MAG TPA: hypothetical protein VMG60_14705 [Burkholderiaceae bacterium]|nr:hypothetical protein [Burkholderiaceae bacterium]